MSKLAREHVGESVYKRTAHREYAPVVCDCSSFMLWLFDQVGVVLPRFAFEQFDVCKSYHIPQEAQPGDLIFRQCRYFLRYSMCPLLHVGHVGFLTTSGTVIHANHEQGTVSEENLATFFAHKKLGLCAGRVLP